MSLQVGRICLAFELLKAISTYLLILISVLCFSQRDNKLTYLSHFDYLHNETTVLYFYNTLVFVKIYVLNMFLKHC